MKVFRLIAVITTFPILMITASAQTRMVTNNHSGSSRPASALANVVAIIDSGDFTDEKAGISRVVSAMNQLNAKFDPLQKEIKGMRDRLDSLQADLEKSTDPSARQRLQEQGEQLNVQIKRRAEDAQNDYKKQMNIALQPLQVEINEALNAYAQAHGILLIIDVNRVPVIYANESIDITGDFITEYNRTHPATPARP